MQKNYRYPSLLLFFGLICSLIATSFVVASPALAEQKPNFYVFGDSGSDVGAFGFVDGSGSRIVVARPTNLGNNWSESLSKRLGLTATSASAAHLIDYDAGCGTITAGCLVGNTATGGNNYAISGATAVAYPDAFTLSDQVDFFASDHSRFNKNDLVIVSIYRNDITTAFGNGLSYDANDYASTYISQIDRMKNLGARNIVALGAEIDLIPTQFVLDSGYTPSQLNDLRTQSIASEQALWPLLKARGVYIIDFNRLAEDVRLNLPKYGFTSGTDDYQQRGVPSPLPPEQVPNDGNVFTTDGHFTTALQAIQSDFYLAQIRARDQYMSILEQTATDYRTYSDRLTFHIIDRMLEPSFTNKTWRPYLDADYDTSSQSRSTLTDARLSSNTWRIQTGVDGIAFSDVLTGINLQLSQSDNTFSDRSGSGNRTAGIGSFYVAKPITNHIWVDSRLDAGYVSLDDISRKTRLGAIALASTQGDTYGTQMGATAGLNYRGSTESISYNMRVGASQQNTELKAYQEKPGVLALAYDNASYNSTLGTVSTHFESADKKAVIQPFMDVAYSHDFNTDAIKVGVGSEKATIVPYVRDRNFQDSVTLQVGSDVRISDTTQLTASAYSTLFSQSDDFSEISYTYGVSIDLKISF